MIICKYCQQPIKSVYKKFCSIKCERDYIKERKCLFCGKKIKEESRLGVKYCSIKCRQHYRDNDLEKKIGILLSRCKRRAKYWNKNDKRNCTLSEIITIQDIKDILKNQNNKCYYTNCDITANNISIDRIDSDIGYIKSNIVICDGIINIMKYTLTSQEFIKRCTQVARKAQNIN